MRSFVIYIYIETCCNILTIREKLFWWLPGHSLCTSQFFKLQTLSNMTKLILLDSLLQEVCINSGLAGRSPRVRSGWVSVLFSHKPSLFRTNESPLNPREKEMRETMFHVELVSFTPALCLRPYHDENMRWEKQFFILTLSFLPLLSVYGHIMMKTWDERNNFSSWPCHFCPYSLSTARP